MKKGFERPSQKDVVVASENGVNVVADIPTADGAKEVGGVASKYVKYNEVVDASKINCFKPTLINKADKNFLSLNVKIARNYDFNINATKMLSMRWRLRQVRDKIKEQLAAWVKKDINTRRTLNDNEVNNDAEYRMSSGIIKDVLFANSKEKEFIAVLDKFTVVQDEVGTDLISTMYTDPHFKINTDVIPNFVKMLAVEPFEVKHYGEELVVVLDIDKVMANVMLRSIIAGPEMTDIEEFIKLGKTVYANGYINTIITVDGVPATEKGQFTMSDEVFVCGRFQFTHDMFKQMLLGKKETVKTNMDGTTNIVVEYNPLARIENGANDIIFVRTADLAAQTSGAEALKLQMTGLPSGVNYTTIPLIKIPKSKYTIKHKSTGNPLLDSLLSNASTVETVDHQAILNNYRLLLDGKVFSFNVGFGGGRELCILPNFRNLVAYAIFGESVMSSGSRLPKIDIADNGHSIAVAASL